MKKEILLLASCLLLCGCTATPFGDDNPYRVDTVVQIPVDPTEEPTEVPTEITKETEMPTETAPEETTVPKTTTSGSSKSSTVSKNTASNNSSSKGSSGKTSTSKATDPAVTEAPTETATEPEVTLLAETEPPETEAPATEAPTQPPYDPGSYSVGSLEYAILEQMNSHRHDAELGAFSMNTKLCGIAALRAEELYESWSHTRPDGRSYTTAMSDYGYGFSTAAESLLYVSSGSDAASIVEKWMSSDEHTGFILSGSFSTIGIGIYAVGGFTYIAVLYVG